MAEFECPFEKGMLEPQSGEIRTVVIKGNEVNVSAVDAGGDLRRECLLRLLDRADFVDVEMSESATCRRCGKTITFREGFPIRLPDKPSTVTQR